MNEEEKKVEHQIEENSDEVLKEYYENETA
jgi:hypothetical protein